MDTQAAIVTMNASEYKKYHESLMQNNHGSSACHVFFCMFFTVQCSVYSSLRLRNVKSNRYLYEYLIIVLPLILAHTLLSDHIYFLNFIVITMILHEFIKYCNHNVQRVQSNPANKKIYAISILRGLTYLITVCAILAVDFKDFPRYLAKTEKYGYSLMDTGVGLFVLISGLVHKDLKNHNLTHIVKSNFKFLSVLTFLGIARYLSVKQLDYQEHVTEYGVHWNFFFTLAVCKLLSTVIMYFDINALIYSFILLFVHETILYLGVQGWVFSNVARDTLISANREGISSCLGYVSMYLFAAYVKQILSAGSAPLCIKLFNCITFNIDIIKGLLMLGSNLLWVSLYVVSLFRPASRTLANASYCIYLEACFLTVITYLYFIENAFQGSKISLQEPKLIDSVNSNGLVYFLIANLLTGAINLSIRTLFVSSVPTFVILNVYMILALSVTLFLKNRGIKL